MLVFQQQLHSQWQTNQRIVPHCRYLVFTGETLHNREAKLLNPRVPNTRAPSDRAL